MEDFRNLTPYAEHHLVSNNTGTTLYAWYTDWMCCDGVDTIRAVLKSKNGSANFSWSLAIQYAAVRTDEPGTPGTLGNATTGSNEVQTGDLSVAANAAGQRWFRLGIAYTSTNASVQQGDVALQASWKSLGTQLGKARATLAITDSSTKYEVLSPWMPAIYMTKVKAVFQVNSITPANGNFKYRLACQTATTAVSQPGPCVTAHRG